MTNIPKSFLNTIIEMISGLNFMPNMNIWLLFQCPQKRARGRERNCS
jgi:hypothetical protein